MNYLSIDCETGGLGTDVSLLSLGLVLSNKNFEPVTSLQLLTKPDDGKYILEAEGMAINKIDIVKHDIEAKTYKKTGTLLFEYLKNWSNQGKNKLIIIGKQLRGDLLQIWDKLISRNTWEQFCSHRNLDVSSVFMFMQNLGCFPDDASGSLSYLLEYYNLPKDGQHDALWDAKMTLAVLKKMKQSIIDYTNTKFHTIFEPEFRNPFGAGHQKKGL